MTITDIERSKEELIEELNNLRLKMSKSKELKEQLYKFQYIVLNSPLTIIITDHKGNIEYVNSKFSELTGYNMEEVLGQNCRIFKSGKQAPEFYKDLWDTILSCKVWEGAFINKKKTGEFFWEAALIFPITNSEGIITNFVAIKEDISKKKKWERECRKLAKVFLECATPTIIEDCNAIITDVNDAAIKAYGWSRKELVGGSIKQIVPKDLWKEQVDLLHKRCRRGELVRDVEVTRLHKDGTRIPVIITLSLITTQDLDPSITNQDLDLSAIIASHAINISHRKRVEDMLKLREDQIYTLSAHILKAQEEERKRLSAELHDGVGQELALLKLQFSNICNKHKKSTCGDTSSQKKMGGAIALLNQIIENTRRISHDLTPLILIDFGLSTAINKLIKEFNRHYDAIISVDTDNIDRLFPTNQEIIIYRIFQEILNNILKHSQATQISIVIKSHKNNISFIIKDNGVGLTLNQNKTLNVDDDTGIGLITLKERLRIVNATYDICSLEGKGTEINFSIPTKKI